jgi:hypothetical protein
VLVKKPRENQCCGNLISTLDAGTPAATSCSSRRARDEIALPSVHHDPPVASFANAGVNVSDECLDTDHSLASAISRLCDIVCRWLIA